MDSSGWFRFGILILTGLASTLLAGSTAAQPTVASLVRVERGTLPVVLSVPHGGSEPVPGAPERRQGVRLRDDFTAELAEGVLKELETQGKSRPSLVLARFHRRYVDANRLPAEAYESPAAKPVYEAYHGALRQEVASIRKRFGRGLLLDLHGQKTDPDVIHRGTRNGRTVEALVRRSGREAVVGPDSLFGLLARTGYRIYPPGEGKESPSYWGGTIIKTYGSHQPDGIDAIQVEVGRNLRTDSVKRQQLARDLAAAILKFHQEHFTGGR